MVDQEIGQILKVIDEAGMDDDAPVIFTSDNGPVWLRIDVERFGHGSAGGLCRMKGAAWEAGHRMSFVLRWRGKVNAGWGSRQVICFTDLLATLAAILGTELPRDVGEDSFDLLPVVLGEQSEDQPIRPAVVVPAMTGMKSTQSGADCSGRECVGSDHAGFRRNSPQVRASRNWLWPVSTTNKSSWYCANFCIRADTR